ncbi:MAG: sulfatase-like hydrolase/transferase [Marmoricola sp.]
MPPAAPTARQGDVLNKKKPPKKKRHAKKAGGLQGEGKQQASPQTGRPNIVVVMMDDMRADELAYAPTVTSLLTSRGLTFANSFSPYPLCCPARASFLTGQYAHNHGVLATEAPGASAPSTTHRPLPATAGRRLQHRDGRQVSKRLRLDAFEVTGGPSRRYKPPGWTDWMASLDTTAL